MQQASCLEGGPLLWLWPLYLHVNQKSDDDDDDDDDELRNNFSYFSLKPYLYGNFKISVHVVFDPSSYRDGSDERSQHSFLCKTSKYYH